MKGQLLSSNILLISSPSYEYLLARCWQSFPKGYVDERASVFLLLLIGRVHLVREVQPLWSSGANNLSNLIASQSSVKP